MLNIIEFATHGAPRRRSILAPLHDALSFLVCPRPFYGVDNAKLADHYWATETALMRAVRCGDTERAGELQGLHRDIEREMRRRSLL